MLGKVLTVAAILSLATLSIAANQQTKPANQPTATPVGSATAVNAFQIDDTHSCALFRVQHAGASQFWGRINGVSGTFTIADDVTKMAFAVDIAVESIDTGEPKLDGHLKSADFFNSNEFPKLTFKSTSAKQGLNGLVEVAGDLTMHGVTKPITAMIEVTGMADKGMGERGGVEAIFTVKRSDFGMNYGVEKGMVGDAVKVIVGLEGVKAKG